MGFVASIWEDIERSESYLVSGMYDEATTEASAILKDICNSKDGESQLLYDMLESTGMVLVQALKELGRTQQILNELLQAFGSITEIPIQVFLAGVCFQITESVPLGSRELVEEFLSKWKLVDDRYHLIASAAESYKRGKVVIGVDEYVEVVEMYLVALVGGMGMRDMDSAVSWVEKASLPEEKRQDLLRKLHSLCGPKGPSEGGANGSRQSPSSSSSSSHPKDEQTPPPLNGSLQQLGGGENSDATKESIMKWSSQQRGVPWWLRRSIGVMFGNSRRGVAISNGRVVVAGCLMLLMYYIMKRKQRASLKESVKRRALWMRKGLVDLWQLAFSYQVNPLAAAATSR